MTLRGSLQTLGIFRRSNPSFTTQRSRLVSTTAARPLPRVSRITKSLPRVPRSLRVADYCLPEPFLVPCQRSISTRAFPSNRGPIFRFVYRSFAYAGAFILTSGALVIAFFIYDASTYREDLSYSDIPVSEDALNPRRGGPKNLPIADVFVDDDDCADNSKLRNKPKLVILGSGWGSVALLKTLNPDDYHVTVVSPVNYFLFTPMLPSATVGTLELRSLMEPMRRIVQRAKGHFLKAEAVDLELSDKLLEVAQTDSSGKRTHFYLPYDKVVLGVGEFIAAHQVCTLTVPRFNNQPSWRQRS